MAKLLKISKSVLITSFIFIFAFYPLIEVSAAIRAAKTTNEGVQQYDKPIGPSQDSQFTRTQNGGGQGSGTQGGAAGEAAAEVVGCGAGQLLGSLVRKAISGVVSSLKGSATNAVSERVVTTVALRVPTQDADTPAIRDDGAAGGFKETGKGTPTLTGAAASLIPDGLSWDSIGFCLANAAVHYITQSTINWINSGFEGSPTFIQNPEQFFMDAADQEAGGFIEELGLGFMCTSFAPKVRIALVNDYNSRTGGPEAYQKKSQCTLTNTINNAQRVSQSLSSGNLNDFIEYTGNSANRPYGAYLQANDELNRRISVKNGTINFELRNTDFFSFKKCKEVSAGSGEAKKQICDTYSPGTVINDELNNVFDSKYKRLSIADEFDEVISALINQLIKTALNGVLDPVEGNHGDGEPGSESEEGGEEDSAPFITPNIPRPLKLTATCTVSATSTVVGEVVRLDVTAKNGASGKDFTFSWQGIEGATATTSEPSLNIEFTEPATSSVITVEVTSGAKKTTASCPAITVRNPEPLDISCSPDKTRVNVGEPVVWTALASGGVGNYTVLWAGDDDLAGKTNSPTTIYYNDKGKKSGSVTVASGSQTKTATCDDKVSVR